MVDIWNLSLKRQPIAVLSEADFMPFISYHKIVKKVISSHRHLWNHIDDLVQDCSNSIANALKLLESCTKPLICGILSDKKSLCCEKYMVAGIEAGTNNWIY